LNKKEGSSFFLEITSILILFWHDWISLSGGRVVHQILFTELKQKVAAHYWWGAQKPPVNLTELTLKRHHRKKNLVHYSATAQGYPVMPEKDENASDF
jgi:hypothetical protein